jgi:hypothetical protein
MYNSEDFKELGLDDAKLIGAMLEPIGITKEMHEMLKTGENLEQRALLDTLKNDPVDMFMREENRLKYYVDRLRSRATLQVNESMGEIKTNDMILSPQGVFSTHPDDYIMAMKNPASLMSSGGVASISFTIVNESGTQLNVESSRQSEHEGGGIDIEVVVNGIVKKSMLDGEYDQTFASIQMMQKGANISG